MRSRTVVEPRAPEKSTGLRLALPALPSALRRHVTRERALWGLVALVPAAHVAVMLWMILSRTFRTPWWDEWWMVPILQHADAGTLSFHDFWNLHFNSHRIVLPRLIEWGLIDLTHWSRQDLLLFDLLVVLASGALLWTSVWRSVHASWLRMVLLIPLSLVYLSFAQYENWFGPWQLTFLLTIFGVMLTLRAVHESPGKLSGWRGFALGVAGAVIASLSAFGGLAVWVAFFPSVARPRPQRRLRMALWSASALAVVVPYMYHYPKQDTQVSASTLYHLTGFILAGIGSPVTPPNSTANAALAKLLGALGFALLAGVLYIYYRLHRSLDGLIVWLCLALYSLLTTASIGIGRMAAGTVQALDSRYQAFSSLWWIALLVMGAITLQEVLAHPEEARSLIPNVNSQRVLLRGAGLTAVLLCVGCLAASVDGFQKQLAWTNAKLAQEQCILATDQPTDSCLAPFFLPEFVPLSPKDLMAYIKQKRLAIYAQPDMPLATRAVRTDARIPRRICATDHASSV